MKEPRQVNEVKVATARHGTLPEHNPKDKQEHNHTRINQKAND